MVQRHRLPYGRVGVPRGEAQKQGALPRAPRAHNGPERLHDGVLIVELVGVHGVAPPVRHVDLYASRAPHAPTLLALQHLRQLLLREDAEQLLRNHLEQPVQQE